MIVLLKLIALTSIWILGLTIATSKGMVLYFIRQKLESLENKIFEPVILCHWCMPSIHSIFGYAFAYAINVIDLSLFQVIVYYPLVVMGSSIACGFLWSGYKLVEKLTEYYTHMEQHEYWNIKDRKENHFKKIKQNL